METQQESDHLSSRGLFPSVWTKDGQDVSAVRRLELDVAETAGLAARAVAVTGAYIAVAGVDPIANWSLMSSPKAPTRASRHPNDSGECEGSSRGHPDRRPRLRGFRLAKLRSRSVSCRHLVGCGIALDDPPISSSRAGSGQRTDCSLEDEARAQRCRRHRFLATDFVTGSSGQRQTKADVAR
jgi:hypothetical protein